MTARESWQVISNMAPDRRRADAGAAVDRWHFPPTPLISTYITAHRRRPVSRRACASMTASRSASSAGSRWPRYLDPDEIFEVTRQGFDYFHGAFGVRYPFGKYDQLFVPEFNAGRDGERRRVTFLEDYVFRSRVTDARHEVTGRDDPARDGAHVVRRPGHHALVGRPVAERVVRHLGRARSRRPRPPAGRTPGPRSPGLEGLGVPAGPAAVHPPDRGRHPRHRGRRGQLRRHHLRQGRGRAQAAGRLRRPGELPGRACAPTSAGTPGATPRSPTCSTRWSRRRAGTWRPGPRRGWRRPGSTRCGRSTRLPPTAPSPGSPSLQAGADAHPVLRPHRIAIGLYDRGRGRADPRGTGSSSTSTGERTEVPELIGRPRARPGAGQRRRPDLRQDPARRAFAADR